MCSCMGSSDANKMLSLPAEATATLLPGDVLLPGASITSGSGFLVMESQTGDLCVCAALAAGGASCAPPKLWSAGVNGHPGAWARMAEYGVLEVGPVLVCARSSIAVRRRSLCACGGCDCAGQLVFHLTAAST